MRVLLLMIRVFQLTLFLAGLAGMIIFMMIVLCLFYFSVVGGLK